MTTVAWPQCICKLFDQSIERVKYTFRRYQSIGFAQYTFPRYLNCAIWRYTNRIALYTFDVKWPVFVFCSRFVPGWLLFCSCWRYLFCFRFVLVYNQFFLKCLRKQGRFFSFSFCSLVVYIQLSIRKRGYVFLFCFCSLFQSTIKKMKKK